MTVIKRDEYTSHTDPDFTPTDVEETAIGRALESLSGHGRAAAAMAAAARTALRLLVTTTITQPEPDDPPIAASLVMPTWNRPSGMYPVVDGPLLDLLEVP